MRRTLNRVFIFTLVSLCLVLSYQIWLPFPARFLLVKDEIQKTDCIVPLRGEDYFRFRKAVELFNSGYSKELVVSIISEESVQTKYNMDRKIFGWDRLSERELALKYFQYFGKDAEGVNFTDVKIISTLEEAVATKQWMHRKAFRSLILVTNGYHMRRALLLFKLVFKGSGIKIYHATAETEIYDPQHWWRKTRDAKAMITEYVSLCYNLLDYFILKKGMPSNGVISHLQIPLTQI